jgi:hypothetical protein
MTETTAPVPVCRMPGCDDPLYADGLCLDDWQKFNGPVTDAPPTVPQPRDAAPAAPVAPTGRLRLSPLHAIVRAHYDGSGILGVYGVYGTAELAEGAVGMLKGLGIPDDLTVVPFYEVAP